MSAARFPLAALAILAASAALPATGKDRPIPANKTRADGAASVDARAAALVDAMTLDEQLSLLKSRSGGSLLDLGVPLPPFIPEAMRQPKPKGAIGTAGFVPAIERLGFPALQLADASLGGGADTSGLSDYLEAHRQMAGPSAVRQVSFDVGAGR